MTGYDIAQFSKIPPERTNLTADASANHRLLLLLQNRL